MRLLHDDAGYRRVKGIPFERVILDPRALAVACDQYAEMTGDVDEVAFGAALITYLEGAE